MAANGARGGSGERPTLARRPMVAQRDDGVCMTLLCDAGTERWKQPERRLTSAGCSLVLPRIVWICRS